MLREFEAFLPTKGTVKAQYLPFYLKWVSDCYAYLDQPLSERPGAEQNKQFQRTSVGVRSPLDKQ